MPSHKNIEVNQSVFGSYLWISFSTKSVCRLLFCYVLVCGALLYTFWQFWSKKMSNFGNSCKKSEFICFGAENAKIRNFVWKTSTQGTFDVELSLAKGVIFTKIVLANGAILKMWRAHPYAKLAENPP